MTGWIEGLHEEDNISTNERDIFVEKSPGLAEGFTGTIDNIAIFKRAKQQHEIEKTYASIVRRGGNFDGDKDRDAHQGRHPSLRMLDPFLVWLF